MIRKRPNKDGTVRFQARVVILGQAVFRKFDSHQDATEWVNEMRFKRDKRMPCLQTVTVDDMYSNYLESAKNRGLAPSSIRRAELVFKNHLKPFYGEANMASVDIHEHRAFMTILREKELAPATEGEPVKHLAPATINRARSLLSAMFNTAVTQRTFGDLITSNPLQAVTPMKEKNHRIVYWDQKTIARFLDSERSSHYYPLWVLMLNTGMRVGEAAAIHGEQIDRFADILTVDRIFCMVSNAIRNQTKSCRLREVGLNEPAREVLYPIATHDGPVFLTKMGGRLRTDYLMKRVFPDACLKAKVKNIGLHGLRHTFASHYMMAGGNLYDLQKILGHSSIKQTERYAHFSRLHIQQKSNVVGFSGNVIAVDFNRKEAFS